MGSLLLFDPDKEGMYHLVKHTCLCVHLVTVVYCRWCWWCLCVIIWAFGSLSLLLILNLACPTDAPSRL